MQQEQKKKKDAEKKEEDEKESFEKMIRLGRFPTFKNINLLTDVANFLTGQLIQDLLLCKFNIHCLLFLIIRI